ncbi:MAG: protoheme IX farnesyltransferase [Cryomorphaceae bacterium]|nr:protoheme IX farnesyltransferase [Cryomorphaceae bacterium]MBT4813828.1 protoheme IX farnesyltransferase [Cryomorphaceae bacterium]MBT5417464.1 protoheme IX farnesyltransferase [Cryomorphaceae bacterium]MBT7683313.1 protoheme IX farnesyltransferase [Cryomorphaceae bacterium]MBT7694908.1 protoheme IX farnesyltransferase [Cryomorphaceae bacterium]
MLILIKHRLSLSVVFSSVASYLIAFEVFSLYTLMLLIFGGFFVVGASNGFNQIIERKRDALMTRTQNRPLPTGGLSLSQAILVCVILSFLGLFILYIINFRTAFFGFLSMIIYLAIYTPLKPITPLSVFFGAIPGAIPFMLGWVAVTNQFSIETGILFMIQFFWQFPHFWAIGWVSHDDYLKGGFKMLPSGKRDNSTAFQIVFYTIWMILVSTLPYFSFTGDLTISFYSLLLILVSGCFMLFQAIRLMKYKDKQNAIRLMYTSIFYLSFIQIIFVVDKFIT